jgi:hypothetical protein
MCFWTLTSQLAAVYIWRLKMVLFKKQPDTITETKVRNDILLCVYFVVKCTAASLWSVMYVL